MGAMSTRGGTKCTSKQEEFAIAMPQIRLKEKEVRMNQSSLPIKSALAQVLPLVSEPAE